MAWQTADWFFVGIFLVFVAMLFFKRDRNGAHGGDGDKDAGTQGAVYERNGPKLNM